MGIHRVFRETTIAWSILLGAAMSHAAERPQTFCNPLDLDYRFQLNNPTRREAADPAVVFFKNEYWLFASKSGGYWHSPDFFHWVYVNGTNLPIEPYAPAPAIINGSLHYTGFDTRSMYRADDPQTGAWTKVGDLKLYADPALFQDDDGRVFVYYGCSANGGISAVELDPKDGFKEIGKPVQVLMCDPKTRGWEEPGDDNACDGIAGKKCESWIEGAWMTKINGKYHLEYSGPGTQYTGYANGEFIGDSPLGPFTYAASSPFSYKPGGFLTGAGHGGTFQDARSNWWHISTSVICVRDMFERRVAAFPMELKDDGHLAANSYLGDYPQFLPGTKTSPAENNSPGWMLLSYGKKVEASSTQRGFSVTNAFDEDIRTWWCAESGNVGEWLKVDLGKECRVDALQINFADEGAKMHGKLHDDAYQYYIEASLDGTHWRRIVDRSDNRRDAPHEYVQLGQPVKARHVRLVNVHCPAGAKLSISGFRIFGNGLGHTPDVVHGVSATRNPSDGRKAVVSWPPTRNADFYIVRFGLAPDKLFNSYQIYHATNAAINSLNVGVKYFFAVDAVNDSGVTNGKETAEVGP